MALFFLLCSINQVSAINVSERESGTWGAYVISEPIEPSGENKDIDAVGAIFNKKTISIDNSHVVVGELCNYKFNKEEISPVAYWNGERSASIYKNILSKYKVMDFSTVELFTPLDPSEKCPYPFSYFIKINERLIFTQNNRLVIYSQSPRVIVENECVHKKQTPEEVYEYGDINTCKFKSVNVIDAYDKYRKNINGMNASNLTDNLSPNKDSIVKCNNECIETNYKWNGVDHLVIKQKFVGGETIISFDKKSYGVLVEEKLFSD